MKPRTLYKYCSPDRIDIIVNRLIRFTQREDLNDIYEMRPVPEFNETAYQAARAKVAQTQPSILNAPSMTAADHANALDETMQHALILSLSSRWDVIPMWSYYACGHKGLAIGFDFNPPFLTQSTTGPVGYTARFPVASGTKDFPSAVFSKFSRWKHEHEWRSLRVLGHDKPGQIKNDQAGSPMYLYAFLPTAVREVVLGHRISDDSKQRIMQILRDPAYNHVRLFQATPDNKAWVLKRKRLPLKV